VALKGLFAMPVCRLLPDDPLPINRSILWFCAYIYLQPECSVIRRKFKKRVITGSVHFGIGMWFALLPKLM